MANLASSKKAIRVSERKRVINLRRRRAMKISKKDVQKALDKGSDPQEIQALISKSYKEIDKAAKKNVIHKNTAARYKSKLMAYVKAKSNQ